MRRRLTAVILILMITFSIVSSEYLTAYAEGTKDGPTIKILFVGNSFTERNNLHKIFKGISKANGYKVKTKKLAYGGYKLRKYSSSKTKAGKKLRKLLKKDWDYVVIQGHSEEFVKSYNSIRIFDPDYKNLIKYIISPNGIRSQYPAVDILCIAAIFLSSALIFRLKCGKLYIRTLK